MAKDNPQSSKQPKSSSVFNIFRRPISLASEQDQGYSSKSSSLKLPKIFAKSPSTTPNQSTSSLLLASSTVDSRGNTALGEHAIIYLFVLLSKLNVESSIATIPSGMRRIITSRMAYSSQSQVVRQRRYLRREHQLVFQWFKVIGYLSYLDLQADWRP